jgi:hypothetical protein
LHVFRIVSIAMHFFCSGMIHAKVRRQSIYQG